MWSLAFLILSSKGTFPNHTQIAGGSPLQLKHYIGPTAIATCSIIIALVVLLGEIAVQVLTKRRNKPLLACNSDLSFYYWVFYAVSTMSTFLYRQLYISSLSVILTREKLEWSLMCVSNFSEKPCSLHQRFGHPMQLQMWRYCCACVRVYEKNLCFQTRECQLQKLQLHHYI